MNRLLTCQFWLKKVLDTLIILIEVSLIGLLLSFGTIFFAGKLNDNLLCLLLYLILGLMTYWCTKKIINIWELWR